MIVLDKRLTAITLLLGTTISDNLSNMWDSIQFLAS